MNTIIQAIGKNMGPDNFLQENISLVPVKQNDISVIFCLTGSVVISMNDARYPIGKGQGVVIFKGSYLTVTDRSEDFSFVEVVLPSGLLREHMQANNIVSELAILSKYPVFGLAGTEQEDFTRLAQICNSMKYRQGKYNDKCIVNIYLSLVYFVCEAAQRDRVLPAKEVSGANERQYYYFFNFLNLLSQHCREERNVKFYADKLCITPKYLSTIVKSVSNKTASGWIDEFVISEAKQHLRFSGKSIQEISYMLNFSTQSFFGKYFKRLTGMSPIRYKTQAAIA